MGIVLKILTIVGSVLGTIAFVQNIAKEVVSVNKEMWKRITEIIAPVDFDNLQYQIEGRRLRGSLVNKLETLVYAIEKNNLDVIGFKGLIRNTIHSRLLEIRNLYRDLRQYVQVPYWNPFEDKAEGKITYGYEFDKSFFFQELNSEGTRMIPVDGTEQYVDHLQKAATIAAQMEKEFLEVQKLANKESFEFFLFWK